MLPQCCELYYCERESGHPRRAQAAAKTERKEVDAPEGKEEGSKKETNSEGKMECSQEEEESPRECQGSSEEEQKGKKGLTHTMD